MPDGISRGIGTCLRMQSGLEAVTENAAHGVVRCTQPPGVKAVAAESQPAPPSSMLMTTGLSISLDTARPRTTEKARHEHRLACHPSQPISPLIA